MPELPRNLVPGSSEPLPLRSRSPSLSTTPLGQHPDPKPSQVLLPQFQPHVFPWPPVHTPLFTPQRELMGHVFTGALATLKSWRLLLPLSVVPPACQAGAGPEEEVHVMCKVSEWMNEWMKPGPAGWTPFACQSLWGPFLLSRAPGLWDGDVADQ